jgi:hypothetical protein
MENTLNSSRPECKSRICRNGRVVYLATHKGRAGLGTVIQIPRS